ncbi:MAG TPA: phage tail sheath subtilisin-like domain-containing protein [Roseiflexaceae bacterium]|nr:phage tail sheath subtilisin-like domain-containing protein [Roseiflexaceae bacterium]
MPEYLAPGVFVEEISFRSKSIEGVGTSTTGFAGPTRTGPLSESPELLTSFADFERIYGGLDNLSFGTNYLAHAVRAYFNEGGARLYVTRVFAGDTSVRASVLVATTGSGGGAKHARFVARFPGSAGNGALTLSLAGTPVTLRAMKAAPEGTLLRTGTSGTPAEPARITSSLNAPFSLANNTKLLLTVGGAEKELLFKGEAALVTSDDPLPETVTVAPGDTLLRVTIDGVAQQISLPAGDQPRAELADLINRELRGGFARLNATDELEIGSDRRGNKASVAVKANPSLKFPADTADTNTADANNTVENLASVSVQEINNLLIAGNIPARLLLKPTNEVLLSTVDTGASAKLQIRTGADSAESALGFASGPEKGGTAGTTIKNYVKSGNSWIDADGNTLALAGLTDNDAPSGGAEIVTLSVTAVDVDGNVTSFDGLALDGRHPRYIGNVLAQTPSRRSDALYNRYAFVNDGVSAFAIIGALFAVSNEITLPITGGGDGLAPQPADYEKALKLFEGLEDISIVAAPGSTSYGDPTNVHLYANVVTSHAETRRLYRIAVLDSPPAETTVGGVREFRGKLIDSTRAALYFPWVVVANPSFRTGADNIPREIVLPPSGFVAGIYARNDITRGVYKAPANEPVRGALRFAVDINTAQQEVLNPLGVNCLRFLSGRGYRVWGARTVSSDPEWKYVNVRRYFNYLEASIDRGSQWAVFEPNGERLWDNIRATIENFLYNEWVSGALLGSSPQEAFFVRCDRSTMTQNDLDNGRLICLVGVAPLKPAEFVIFRIGQKTADARS